jgi:hypothetical protein
MADKQPLLRILVYKHQQVGDHPGRSATALGARSCGSEPLSPRISSSVDLARGAVVTEAKPV